MRDEPRVVPALDEPTDRGDPLDQLELRPVPGACGDV
jgi:hypothetical protein